MKRSKRPAKTSSWWIGRVLSIAAGVVVVGLVVTWIWNANRTVELRFGESAETPTGIISVQDWEESEAGVDVLFSACRTASGHLVDLRAFRLVVPSGEIEPLGSDLGSEAGGCVDGTVSFPTDEPPDQVVYTSSPDIAWHPTTA